MYKRLIDIVVDLTEKKAATVQELADRYHVSVQSIRKDVNNLNDLLETYQFEKIAIKKGTLLCPDNFIELKKYINLRCSHEPFYFYHLSKEETAISVMLILLCAQNYVTIDAISETLGVSRSTLFDRLALARERAAAMHLNLKSTSNKGMLLLNTEAEKRMALAVLIRDTEKDNEFLLNLLARSCIAAQEDRRDAIAYIICQFQLGNDLTISDHVYRCLTYYLHYTVDFILKGVLVDASDPEGAAAPGEPTPSFLYAQKLMNMLSEQYSIPCLDTEVRFLSRILDTYIEKTSPVQDSSILLKLQLLTNLLISNVAADLQINLASDYQLYESLLNHLVSIYKNNTNEEPDPTLLKHLEGSYHLTTSVVYKHIHLVETLFQRTFTDAEVFYIILHFSAAVERFRNSNFTYDVIVAYTSGGGASHLIQARLAQISGIRIVRMIGYQELNRLTPESADLLISSVPVFKCPIPFVNISNRVTSEDLLQISNKISEMRSSGIRPLSPHGRSEDTDAIITEIRPILSEYSVPDPEIILSRIRNVLYRHLHQPDAGIQKEAQPSYLNQILTPEWIHLDAQYEDWKEAVRMSAAPFVARGYCTEAYSEEIIEATLTHGPYYVTYPGVAILHGTPGKNCSKLGIGLTRLLTPLEFGEEETLTVSYIIFLSIIDKNSHLKALFTLLNLLQDEMQYNRLNQANSNLDAYKLIYEYESNPPA